MSRVCERLRGARLWPSTRIPSLPERGQWGFTQALIREVAYSTLSRKERRERHVAAARYFEGLEDEEVSGMLATHYLDAYLASPDGPEADTVAAQARVALRAAAERAAALGSHGQAIAYLRRGLDAAPGPGDSAQFLEEIAREEFLAGRLYDAEATAHRAAEAYDAIGNAAAALRVTAKEAEAIISRFEAAPAIAILVPAVERALTVGDDTTTLLLEAQLARGYMFNEEPANSLEWSDRTLVTAERLSDLAVIADVLVTKGIVLGNLGRIREGIGLMEVALRLAEANDLSATVIRARLNLAAQLPTIDPRAALEVARQGWDDARRAGVRFAMAILMQNALESAIPMGGSQWAEDALDELLEGTVDDANRSALLGSAITIRVLRGRPFDSELDELRELAARAVAGTGADWALAVAEAWIAFGQGDYEAAIRGALELAPRNALNAPLLLRDGARSAVLARDPVAAREQLRLLAATGVRGPTLDLERDVVEAGVVALEGRWAEATVAFDRAIRRLGEVGLDLDVGFAWLSIVAVAPAEDPLAARAEEEARAIFERLHTPPFIAQLDRLVADRAARGTVVPTTVPHERAPV